MIAQYKKHVLHFKRPSGTSRGILVEKETWFLILTQGEKKGIGECGLLRGLSIDDQPDYEAKLAWVCANIHLGKDALYESLTAYPSIQMGMEMAFLSLHQVEKLAQGFSCIKMKVGAIDFLEEVEILKAIRKRYSADKMVLRVDANGAFEHDPLEKLSILADLDLHSIEQPIPQGNWEKMKALCKVSPLPIALDEELIGVFDKAEKIALLETICPQYIILKPSFIGGFQGAEEWTNLARERGIDAWVTSALESNVGLNAIAQWAFHHGFQGHQGLGTGSLFKNNVPAPLEIKNGYINIDKTLAWRPIDQLLS